MTTETHDPQLVELLRQNATEILETMISMPPSAAEPLAEASALVSAEVIGVLSFTGTTCGSFVVCTSERRARAMAAAMLMMEPEELTDFAEVADAFGEIVNMVSGGFKNAWVAEGRQMNLSVPHVIERGQMKLHSKAVAGVHSGVRLTVDGEPLDIGIYFEG